MNITCPDCQHKYDTEVFEIEPYTLFEEEECPKCSGIFSFSYELCPSVLVAQSQNIKK